jgi:hypothetical protein
MNLNFKGSDPEMQSYIVDGSPTIPNLHVSLQALVKANGGVPAFSGVLKRNSINWRVRLFPPFQLFDGEGEYVCKLHRNIKEETKDLLVLNGVSSNETAFKVIIPATVHNTYRNNHKLKHVGELRVGEDEDLEHCSFLFR